VPATGGIPAQQGRLLERDVLRRLAEVQTRGRLDAVRAVPEVHVIGVEGQDLPLRVALLDQDGDEGLFDLPFQAEIADVESNGVRKEISRELAG